MALLEIRELAAGTATRAILRGIDLSVGAGEVHALMGPNGSGKSTLAHVLAGRPDYVPSAGSVTLDGADLLALPAHARARAGLFVSFQSPVEVPGVGLRAFLREAAVGAGLAGGDVDPAALDVAAQRLGLTHVLDRALNDGLSGGERKRNETLQLTLLGAKVAVLDEIDSGLDVDGIRQVAAEVRGLVEERGLAVVVITHFGRILESLPPTHAHVLIDGVIVADGGPELVAEIEARGYDHLRPATAASSGSAAPGAGALSGLLDL